MKQIFKLLIEFFAKLFSKNKGNELVGIYLPTEANETEEQEINESNVCQEMNDEILSSPRYRNCVILIDNGHGENTKGKRSPYTLNGIKPELDFYEYKWNREIAKAIVERLVSMDFDARLLVPEEKDISLSERVKRANDVCADIGKKNVILISIHANAAGKGNKWMNAKGWSAYTTKGKTESDVLAESLYKAACYNFYDRKIRTDMSDGDRDWEENFTILYNTYCPAVLTENFFYDNVDDLEYMLSEKGKEAIITAHLDGIIDYLKIK